MTEEGEFVYECVYEASEIGFTLLDNGERASLYRLEPSDFVDWPEELEEGLSQKQVRDYLLG